MSHQDNRGEDFPPVCQFCLTETRIHYSSTRDEYSVTAGYRNANINDKYYIKGEFRQYDGFALMKHALHNTTPDITKSAKATDNEGKVITVKVRDGEKIQLANAKIDEIRTGFTDWLQKQSPEFKNRMADMYNGSGTLSKCPNWPHSTAKSPTFARQRKRWAAGWLSVQSQDTKMKPSPKASGCDCHYFFLSFQRRVVCSKMERTSFMFDLPDKN